VSKIKVTRDTNRTLQNIANELNRISDSVQEGFQGNPNKDAKIRTVKNSDGTYSIEFKHRDGWLTTSSGTIERKEIRRVGSIGSTTTSTATINKNPTAFVTKSFGKEEIRPAKLIGKTDTTVDFGKAMTVGDAVFVPSSNEYMTIGTLVSGTTYNVTRAQNSSTASDYDTDTDIVILGHAGDEFLEFGRITDTPYMAIKRIVTDVTDIEDIARYGAMEGIEVPDPVTGTSFTYAAGDFGLWVGEPIVANNRSSYIGFSVQRGAILKADGSALDLSANSQVASNSTNIVTNSTNISINSASISSNATSITTNANGISTNTSNISQNASNIALKVSSTDYNGTTIASKINIEPASVSIDSKNLNITGTSTFANGHDIATALNYGTTTIDGGMITARTIAANKIFAGSITAYEIAAATITVDKLNVTTLSAISADLGTVTSGTFKTSAGTTQRVEIGSSNKISFYDNNNNSVEVFGKAFSSSIAGVFIERSNTDYANIVSTTTANQISVYSGSTSATLYSYIGSKAELKLADPTNNITLDTTSGLVVNSTTRLDISGNATLGTVSCGAITSTSTIATADPGSGVGVWKLGKHNTRTGGIIDNNNYIEVMIDGVLRAIPVLINIP